MEKYANYMQSQTPLPLLSLSLSVSAKSNTPSWDKCVCSRQKPIMRGSMLHETMRIMRAAPSPDISPSVFLSLPFCLFFLPLLFLFLFVHPSLNPPIISISLCYNQQRSSLPETGPLPLSCSCVEEL